MTVALYSVSILLMIALPLLLAVVLRRRYVVPWWLFSVGMLTFIGSQIVHLPLNNWLGDIGLLVERTRPEGWTLVRNALLLGLTAGLSEEIARAVGYLVLFSRGKAERWEDSVMLGLGHGGIEAMSFGAVLTAASLASLWALRGTDLDTLSLSVEQLAAVRQQMEMLLATPWVALAPLIERLLAITIHVSLSVVVWMAFKRRNWFYLPLAIVLHMLYDAFLVYLSQQTTNVWLLEGVMVLLTLPALLWLWYLWRGHHETVTVRRTSLIMEWKLFGVALRKELLQQWRTKRVLVIAAVFTLFGLLSPLIANFTPELLRSIEGAEQFADLVPTPTTVDALAQYIKNITQFGFIIAVLLGMGAIAGEKEKGTTAMILSKPLPRWAFVLSKFVAQMLVYLLGFVLAAMGAYYYTLILFEPLALGPFLLGNLLLFVWLLAFAAVTLLASALTSSTGAAAAVALAGAVVLLLAGGVPQIGQLAPGALVAWASQLGLETTVPVNAGGLVATAVLIVVCLITAIAAFEVQEL